MLDARTHTHPHSTLSTIDSSVVAFVFAFSLLWFPFNVFFCFFFFGDFVLDPKIIVVFANCGLLFFCRSLSLLPFFHPLSCALFCRLPGPAHCATVGVSKTMSCSCLLSPCPDFLISFVIVSFARLLFQLLLLCCCCSCSCCSLYDRARLLNLRLPDAGIFLGCFPPSTPFDPFRLQAAVGFV